MRRWRGLGISGFLCCFILAQSDRAAETPELAQGIDAIATRALAKPVAGISIAVARNGKLLPRARRAGCQAVLSRRSLGEGWSLASPILPS
jgi:hypothetical protein